MCPGESLRLGSNLKSDNKQCIHLTIVTYYILCSRRPRGAAGAELDPLRRHVRGAAAVRRHSLPQPQGQCLLSYFEQSYDNFNKILFTNDTNYYHTKIF